MKVPLVGENYALRSPAAAAQQTLNLIPQFFDDDGSEQNKNKGLLIGTPGYHQIASIGSSTLRGLWSGGGRLFAVTKSAAGKSALAELGIGTYQGGTPSLGAGTIVSGPTNLDSSTLDDGKPAQMFGDGNQLLIVKNGYAYLDQGNGPVLCRLLISGTVNTNGTAVTWVSGNYFTPAMASRWITINGTNYLIASVNSDLSITLQQDAGIQNGALWESPAGDPLTAVTGAYLDGYFIVQRPPAALRGTVNANGTAVTWVSGDQFSQMVVGQPITINNVACTVAAIASSTSITASIGLGTGNGVQYSAPIQTLAGTVSTTGNQVGWVSGSQFEEIEPGQAITINGLSYTVAEVQTIAALLLTTSAGLHTGVAFAAQLGSDPGRTFNISYPDDGNSWDPLDYASKEGYPDYLQSILADHEQLYLFGTESMEVWQNAGNVLFPLARVASAMAKEGSSSRYAPTAMGEKVYFIGGSSRGGPVAFRLDGFTPVRISTHAVEQAWASGIDRIADAVAYAEVHDGHQFWVINFPGALNTWVYDETASQQTGRPIWHQRAAWTGAAFAPYVPRFHTFVPEWGPAGMHVVGDYASGTIHELNLNYYDDNGSDKAWSRILPHLYAAGHWLFFGRITLEMETGTTGSVVTQPAITLDYSEDRGHTFINPMGPLPGGAGVQGAYSQRVFWPSWGASRDRVPRLRGAGQYRTALIDLDIDVEAGGA